MTPFRLPPGLIPFSVLSSLTGRLKGAVGGALGIGFVAWTSLWLAHRLTVPVWLVAPVGASAVLVFAAPASPLAQPLSVIAGNTISALCGIAVAYWLHDPVLASAVAVGVAIAVMSALGCLHPPGGAVALMCAMTQIHDPLFAIFPVLINSILLVAAAIAYRRLLNPARSMAPMQAETPPD